MNSKNIHTAESEQSKTTWGVQPLAQAAKEHRDRQKPFALAYHNRSRHGQTSHINTNY